MRWRAVGNGWRPVLCVDCHGSERELITAASANKADRLLQGLGDAAADVDSPCFLILGVSV